MGSHFEYKITTLLSFVFYSLIYSRICIYKTWDIAVFALSYRLFEGTGKAKSKATCWHPKSRSLPFNPRSNKTKLRPEHCSQKLWLFSPLWYHTLPFLDRWRCSLMLAWGSTSSARHISLSNTERFVLTDNIRSWKAHHLVADLFACLRLFLSLRLGIPLHLLYARYLLGTLHLFGFHDLVARYHHQRCSLAIHPPSKPNSLDGYHDIIAHFGTYWPYCCLLDLDWLT